MSVQTLKLAWRYAAGLGLAQAGKVYLEDISEQWLAGLNADAVILDHDGVLGPNRSVGPDEGGIELIKMFVRIYGPGNVYILSNTHSRRQSREEEYSKLDLGQTYLQAERKPGHEGLKIAAETSGTEINKIAVFDDGLFTGILMAVSAGAIPVYVMRKRMAENIKAMALRHITTTPQIILTKIFSSLRG